MTNVEKVTRWHDIYMEAIRLLEYGGCRNPRHMSHTVKKFILCKMRHQTNPAANTAQCETCGCESYDNEDPDTGQLWCRKCDGWRWFKWPKTGERHVRKPRKTGGR